MGIVGRISNGSNGFFLQDRYTVKIGLSQLIENYVTVQQMWMKYREIQSSKCLTADCFFYSI